MTLLNWLFLISIPFVLASCATTADVPERRDLGDARIAGAVVDRMVFFETADAFAEGEYDRARLSESADTRILLADERERFPRRGEWQSPVVEADFPFFELVPSWNAEVPENTGVEFYVRSRDQETEEWSPWLYIGKWGRTVTSPRREVRFDHGRVQVDILRLYRPADAFQVRARLLDFNLTPGATPSLKRVTAVYSGMFDDAETAAEWRGSAEYGEDWARDMPMAFQAQGEGPACIKGSICSPTSLSMLLNHWGTPVDYVAAAQEVYDPDHGIFGNWARATQYAATRGHDAWVTRVSSWEELKSYISNGQPLIVSIRFSEGEFPSAVLDSTGGHLIVIRGLTEEGDAIVNDPASIEHGEGAIYKKEELKRAWFGHGGIAYVIQPRDEMER
mgnify:CR=1 FL=1